MGKSDKGKGQRFLAQSLGFCRWVCCGLLLLHKRLLLGRRNVFALGFVSGEGFDVFGACFSGHDVCDLVRNGLKCQIDISSIIKRPWILE
jgi:hypothetical protein